ncbi:DUF6471 domain-containing protein [Marinibactrum halimedae]|uniref:DUF6471 domain-containing protein n=1 Tax=Marinibactrum halimedae TaxID=1444977 RepID=A0AA37WMH8_9GAMM|nr:DUF6471 domain-containing protein [Marinibactrum halimedae]MCD9459173.1 DUF6471 domain-containing protein [Marinibactrum halimedae]GLS27244.1 hypothetical protein GCM10007877_29630 [Marinibactrum halimedae]
MKQDQSVQNKEALAPYKTAIARYVRASMVLRNLRYDDLATALETRGISLSPDNLRSKVSKGIFSADLFLALLDVMEVGDSACEEVLKLVREQQNSD